MPTEMTPEDMLARIEQLEDLDLDTLEDVLVDLDDDEIAAALDDASI
ncbi:MAG TPA: hypothetical protein VFL66_03910 [Gaiellaceae bacterium]|nr:hypothetical protein [Gaiellaceae bacterium]